MSKTYVFCNNNLSMMFCSFADTLLALWAVLLKPIKSAKNVIEIEYINNNGKYWTTEYFTRIHTASFSFTIWLRYIVNYWIRRKRTHFLYSLYYLIGAVGLRGWSSSIQRYSCRCGSGGIDKLRVIIINSTFSIIMTIIR